MGDELDRVGADLMGGEIDAQVAIMFDWSSYWSLEGCVGPTQGLRYPDEVHRFYRVFHERNIAVDMIPSTTDAATLARYRMVVAPALIQVLPGVADAVTEYVRGGGTFVTGYMAGIHNEHDLVVPGGYPGELRRLMGVWVEEIDALAPGETVPVMPVAAPQVVDGGRDLARHYGTVTGEQDGTAWSGVIVASLMHLEGARPLAVYGGDAFYAGSPAVTVNEVGDGRAYYVGAPLDEVGMGAVLGVVADGLGLESTVAGDGVEIMRRRHEDGSVDVYVINLEDRAVRASLASYAGARDRLTGNGVSAGGIVELPAYGVMILES